jgi:integrase
MSLYKRANSKFWWMKFTFDGELVQQSTKVANKRDALTIEAAFRHELALGRIGIKPKGKTPTFKQAVADFLKMSELEHAQKPNSFVRIEYACNPLKQFFGETKVDRIEREDVEKFILWRSRQTSRKTKDLITRDSINNELIALKTIFRRLVSREVISKSPAADIKQLAANDRSFHVLTPDEEKIYLLACSQPLQDVASLMLETGMRPVEIYKLKRQAVNLEKGFLQIENGKTKSSNRKVWLSDKALNVLRVRIENCKGNYLFPRNDKDNDAPLFQINKIHVKTVNRIGLKFRLYDLRHTFATRVLDNGTDLLTLASMLGHSSLNHVMRYAHPSETRKNEAIQQMQKKAAKAV